MPSKENVSQHGFVGRAGVEAVGAGQIQQANALAVRRNALSLFAFDGDARIVADFLAEAGEGVEDGCFAAVRVPHKRVSFLGAR